MERKSILPNMNDTLSPNCLECSVCKQRFWMTSKYMDHIATQHLLLSCNICNKGFYNQTHLDTHYLTHNDVISTYDCDKCSRKFLQKFQLEQHIQSHFAPNNPSVQNEKKRVRFSNILPSKHSDDKVSNSGSQSDEENNIQTTHCGKTMKPKKAFENEQEVVCKHVKKSEEMQKREINSTVNVLPSALPSTISNVNHSNISFNKKLHVLVRRMPDYVVQDYIKREYNCTSTDAKKNNVDSENSNQEKPGTKYSGDSFLKKYGAVRLENTRSSEIIGDKFQFNKKNTENLDVHSHSPVSDLIIDISELSEVNKPFVRMSDISNTASQSAEIISDKSGLRHESGLSNKIVDVRDTSMTCVKINSRQNTPVKSLKVSSPVLQNYVRHSPPTVVDKAKLNTTISKLINSTVACDKSKMTLKSKAKTPKNSNLKLVTQAMPSTVPQVLKQILYVGPQKNFTKIKSVMQEMKNPSNKNAKNTNKICSSTIDISSNSLNCNMQISNVSSSSHKAASKRSASAISNSLKCPKEDVSNAKKAGIIDKKMVNDFLVINVTPEYMRKVKDNLNSKNKEIYITDSNTPFISTSYGTKTHTTKSLVGTNKIVSLPDSVEISISPKRYSKEYIASPQKFLTSVGAKPSNRCIEEPITVTLNKSEKCTVNKNSSFSDLAETSNKSFFQQSKNSPHNSDNVLHKLQITVSDRLLERYNAKLEEKERRKKEKYEQKKRLRCIEKKFGKKFPNLPVSDVESPIKTRNNIDSGSISMMKVSKIQEITKHSKVTEQNYVCHSLYKSQVSKKWGRQKRALSTALSESDLIDSMPYQPSKTSILADNSSEAPQIPESIIKKAEEICSKFEKNISEAECLLYLGELNNLVTTFNIGIKCPSIFRVMRFCRLPVNSLAVNEQATYLHTKLLKPPNEY